MKFRFVIEVDVDFENPPEGGIDSDPIGQYLNKSILESVSTDDFVQDFANTVRENIGQNISDFYIHIAEAECTD